MIPKNIFFPTWREFSAEQIEIDIHTRVERRTHVVVTDRGRDSFRLNANSDEKEQRTWAIRSS